MDPIMQESTHKCWVPNCESNSIQHKLFSLPDNRKSREIWLALAGKEVSSQQEKIWFCSEHFSATEILKADNAYFIKTLPFKKMPQKSCRLCLSIIESTNGSEESEIYVLSKDICTEIPSCVENMVRYFVPSNSEPLYKIVSFCIPGLDIMSNPPPLLCKDCFTNAWLFYAFKLLAIEVDKTLRDGIPLQDFSKMVLCRSCPVTSGTNFLTIPEGSGEAQLLRQIFREDGDQKDTLPLRLCKNCSVILSKLEVFFRTCQIAEAKMKRHIALEREFARNRNTWNEYRKQQQSRKQDITAILDNDTKAALQIMYGENIMNLSKCYSIDSIQKTEISLLQWKKETLAKTLLKYGEKIKDGADSSENIKNWSVIRGEMVKYGVQMEIPEMMNMWTEMLSVTGKKCQLKLPLDFLDQLIVQYWKGKDDNNENTMLNIISEPSSSSQNSRKTNFSNENADLQRLERLNDPKPSSSSLYQEVDNMSPPVLTPEVTKVRTIAVPFWNESRKLQFLELIEKEALRLRELDQLTWNQVTDNVWSKYPEYQRYSLNSVRFKINEWRRHLHKGLHFQSKHMEVLKRVLLLFGNSKKSPSKGRQTKGKNKLLKLPRHSYTEQEKVALAKEMSNEFELLKNSNFLPIKGPWHQILIRLHKRGFLNMSLNRLSALWNKIKTSAKIHSKDGRDEVDTAVWNLLQSCQTYIRTKKYKKGIIGSTSNFQDKTSRDSVEGHSGLNTVNKQGPETGLDGKKAGDADGVSSDNINKQDSEINKDNENPIGITMIDLTNKDSDAEHSVVPEWKPIKNDNNESDEDDKFEEKIEPKYSVKTEAPLQTEENHNIKLDFDKLKLVRAMKQEFKEMCKRRESNLKQPFWKILRRLSEKQYSKFTFHDLQNKWRNMKCIAISHQKKGNLTKLDRAILGLINYKNEKRTYADRSDSSYNQSDLEQRDSSSDSEGADGEESESDGNEKPLNVTTLLLKNELLLLNKIKEKLKCIYKEEPGKIMPFRAVFQQLSNNTKEFDLLREKWQKLKDVALQNRKNQKITEVDDKVLKLVMFSRSQKTQNSIAGLKEEKNSDNIENDILPKIDQKSFIRAILKEFNEIVTEENYYRNPTNEAFIRLHKKEYARYRLNEIERVWMNIQQNAFKHRKNNVMTEEDKIFFEISNKSTEYKKKNSMKAKKYTYDLKHYFDVVTKEKFSEPSTSKGETSAETSTLKNPRVKQWDDKDLLTLFKLIKREYSDSLKSREPVLTNPWPNIIKKIAEKKLFKSSDQKEISRLWRKMRQNLTIHENTTAMTPLDWKVCRLLKNHKRNLGILVKDKEPVVPKQRPRPKFIAESDVELDTTPISTKDNGDKMKLDLIKLLRPFGKEAFVSDAQSSLWMEVHSGLKEIGYKISAKDIHCDWNNMVARAKRAMADPTDANEVDRCLMGFMEEVIRMKTEKLSDVEDREECTREDLKVEPISDNESSNINELEDEEWTNSQKTSLNADHIALRDFEDKEMASDHSFSDGSSDTVKLYPKTGQQENQSMEKSECDNDKVSIIDLCSDKELDELLSDVDDTENL